MDWMAEQIASASVCAADLKAGNSVALQALNGKATLTPATKMTLNKRFVLGFKSYALMRKAGCLINPATNAYCKLFSHQLFHSSDTYSISYVSPRLC